MMAMDMLVMTKGRGPGNNTVALFFFCCLYRFAIVLALVLFLFTRNASYIAHVNSNACKNTLLPKGTSRTRNSNNSHILSTR
jgi:hypothetical protein